MTARIKTSPADGPMPVRPHPSVIRPVFERMTITEMVKPYVTPRHQHLNYEIIFVESGIYRCYHNGIALTLGRNELLVVKPGDWHSDVFDKRRVRYMGLGFGLHLAPDMPLSIFHDNTPVERQHFPVRRNEFLQLLLEIHRELRVHDFVSTHIIDALLLDFFYRMIRAIPRAILSDYYLASSRDASFLSKLFLAISQRPAGKISVSALATELGMSESSLAHKCRAILRCSPARLMLRARLDRAVQMLKSTGMLVKEVSAYLGFDDPFHFSRAYKKTFGLAPSAVKKKRPEII